ncbi:hypothetical protein NFI96_030624, partial [Prochilodus magdalenae]
RQHCSVERLYCPVERLFCPVERLYCPVETALFCPVETALFCRETVLSCREIILSCRETVLSCRDSTVLSTGENDPPPTCSLLCGGPLKNRVIQYTEKQMDYSLDLYTYRVSCTVSGADGVDTECGDTKVV